MTGVQTCALPILLALEYKHIKQVGGGGLGKVFLLCFFWPIFCWLGLPIAIVALFSKNLQWKTIPHKDTTSIEDINQYQQNEKVNQSKGDVEVLPDASFAQEAEAVQCCDKVAEEKLLNEDEMSLELKKLKDHIQSHVEAEDVQTDEIS